MQTLVTEVIGARRVYFNGVNPPENRNGREFRMGHPAHPTLT